MILTIKVQEIERGVVRASCPSVPGFVVYGLTHEEARRDIKEAARGCWGSAIREVPGKPSGRLEFCEA